MPDITASEPQPKTKSRRLIIGISPCDFASVPGREDTLERNDEIDRLVRRHIVERLTGADRRCRYCYDAVQPLSQI
jgi:hypothetical protein